MPIKIHHYWEPFSGAPRTTVQYHSGLAGAISCFKQSGYSPRNYAVSGYLTMDSRCAKVGFRPVFVGFGLALKLPVFQRSKVADSLPRRSATKVDDAEEATLGLLFNDC
jgi:hypothetical protein